jgi:hypothetical protein
VRGGMQICSSRPDGCRGDGSKQVIPVLEDHVGGDGPQMLEQAVFGATCDDGGLPEKHDEIGGGMEGKSQQVEGDGTLARVTLPWPKLCSRLYPLVLRTLKVSFPIFQRVRPQVANSATVSAATARSVTKLLW